MTEDDNDNEDDDQAAGGPVKADLPIERGSDSVDHPSDGTCGDRRIPLTVVHRFLLGHQIEEIAMKSVKIRSGIKAGTLGGLTGGLL